MATAGDQHTGGTLVWFYDDQSLDGWVPGTVVKAHGDALSVRSQNGSIVSLTPDQCPLQNPGSLRGVEVRPCQMCPCGALRRSHNDTKIWGVRTLLSNVARSMTARIAFPY